MNSAARFSHHGSAAEMPAWLTPRAKLAISAALVFHLACVVIPPASNPPSAVLGPLFNATSWYTGPLRLNNGYRFFAPDPPDVGYLLRFEVERDNGEVIAATFPDREAHWPRLFYHRHLMLTSRVQGLGLGLIEARWGNTKPILNDGSAEAYIGISLLAQESEGVPEAFRRRLSPEEIRPEPPEMTDVRRLVRSYAEHLLAKYDGKVVRMYLQEHRVPRREMVVTEGVELDAPFLYRTSLLLELHRRGP